MSKRYFQNREKYEKKLCSLSYLDHIHRFSYNNISCVSFFRIFFRRGKIRNKIFNHTSIEKKNLKFSNQTEYLNLQLKYLFLNSPRILYWKNFCLIILVQIHQSQFLQKNQFFCWFLLEVLKIWHPCSLNHLNPLVHIALVLKKTIKWCFNSRKISNESKK